MRIAVQGAPGCFSQQAALNLAPAADILFTRDFPALFAALAQGQADRALVPVENSIVGPIAATQEGLDDPRFRAVGDTCLQIVHCLLAPPGVAIEAIRQVLSHPVALGQCQRFLRLHPEWRQIEYFDTAGSVEEVMAHPCIPRAAIASARAGEIYAACRLASDIGDRQDNFTRFVLLQNR